MLRKLTVMMALTTLSLSLWSQGDNLGAATNLPQPFYTLGTNQAGTLLGGTNSGLALGDGTTPALIDGFYSFTANSQGANIEVAPNGFDVALEIRDDAGTFVAAMNNEPAGVTEEWFASMLTPGNDYVIRVYTLDVAGADDFTILVEELPEANLRPNFSPDPPVDQGLLGYKIADQTKRNNINAAYYPADLTPLVQATMWELVDVDDGTVYTHTITGTNSVLILNDVQTPDQLCFDRTYSVRCQLRLDGKWCGYGPAYDILTESYPEVKVLPEFLNQAYLLQPGFLRTNYLGDGQQIEWHLETNQGSPDGPMEIDYANVGSSSTYCYFQNVECMRYNKIYSVEVRAEYCGMYGPWSEPAAFYTSPLPYTYVRPEYCGLDLYAGEGIFAEYIEGADQYAWQAAPIDPADATMTPVGPALVTTTPTTAVTMGSLGVELGATYRVGCKPVLGVFDTCDDYQEGDYGYFCPITIIDPSAFGALDSGMSPFATDQEEIIADERLEVMQLVDYDLLTFDVRESGLNGFTVFTVVDISGKVIQSERLLITDEIDLVQFPLQAALSTGVYVIQAVSGDQAVSAKIYVQ